LLLLLKKTRNKKQNNNDNSNNSRRDEWRRGVRQPGEGSAHQSELLLLATDVDAPVSFVALSQCRRRTTTRWSDSTKLSLSLQEDIPTLRGSHEEERTSAQATEDDK